MCINAQAIVPVNESNEGDRNACDVWMCMVHALMDKQGQQHQQWASTTRMRWAAPTTISSTGCKLCIVLFCQSVSYLPSTFIIDLKVGSWTCLWQWQSPAWLVTPPSAFWALRLRPFAVFVWVWLWNSYLYYDWHPLRQIALLRSPPLSPNTRIGLLPHPWVMGSTTPLVVIAMNSVGVALGIYISRVTVFLRTCCGSRFDRSFLILIFCAYCTATAPPSIHIFPRRRRSAWCRRPGWWRLRGGLRNRKGTLGHRSKCMKDLAFTVNIPLPVWMSIKNWD